MSAFSSEEDLFRDYDDVAPLSSIFNESEPTNTEFDLNEFSGSAEDFFNYQATDNDASGATSNTTLHPLDSSSQSNDQNSEFNWDALNGSVGDFFNGLPNDNVESAMISTPQLVESPSIASNLPVVSQASGANSHRNSPDARDKSSHNITRFNYEKVKGISSQRCRSFPDILPEDKKRDRFHNSGHQQLWFFILNLLNDFTKKSVIVWTGNQRQFRIKNTDLFSHLWSKHKGVADVQWESLKRTIRTCGKNGMLMAVPSMKHKGRNEEGLFGYVIEVSSYINMTRDELDRVIQLHCETGPLTVGSPIDSSIGYPEGTQLRVMPIMPLDNEGNLLHTIPNDFITVLPQSTNNLTPSFFPSSSVLHHSQCPTPKHPSSVPTSSEIVQPTQSTPVLNSLLDTNRAPSIPTYSPPIHPMQLAAVNIDFSHVFNNDFTMNIHLWSEEGFIPSIVPLDYLNQPFPTQNYQFQPQNQQLNSMNQPFQVQDHPFFAHNQPFHPQNERFDPPF
ncbi:hypothetical protein PRIPAC_71214 [Pristionchus pacificus]|uniref:ETS domain-containing protein n=1 Tax=Pristionchus pacificus TaxID=54126 RepID=A0A2A6CGB9_PRIPA|nr:hypothetical protein PRIPAC_71214 [Pristionchus pacificus]|eukprot:PDM77128.1 hypothetical protein PRIPAC_43040 [Pristionchus pacificus]